VKKGKPRKPKKRVRPKDRARVDFLYADVEVLR